MAILAASFETGIIDWLDPSDGTTKQRFTVSVGDIDQLVVLGTRIYWADGVEAGFVDTENVQT